MGTSDLPAPGSPRQSSLRIAALQPNSVCYTDMLAYEALRQKPFAAPQRFRHNLPSLPKPWGLVPLGSAPPPRLAVFCFQLS